MYDSFTDEADPGATPRNSGPGLHDGEVERDEQRHHQAHDDEGQFEVSRQGIQRK